MGLMNVWACKVASIFDDPVSEALFAEYERESANTLLGPCSPSREMYEAMEAAGMGQCFAAYAYGQLAGFAFVLTSALPHYGRKFASVESLFVVGSSRGGGLGGRLMNAVESYCLEAGCEALFYSAPVGSRLAELMFLWDDRYTNTNHVFCRRLQ